MDRFFLFLIMAKKKQKQQVFNLCIFCGGTGLSKEHIIPDWIGREFPIPHGFRNTRSMYDHRGIYDSTGIHKNEPLGSKKMRNVCVKCNGGWMSRLQSEAKPILLDLFHKKDVTLDHHAKVTLAAWVMMGSIMLEFTQMESKAITKEERVYLMENGVPPANWEIYVGCSREDDPTTIRRLYHTGRHFEPKPPLMPLATEKANWQTTIIGIERSLFVARSTHVDYLVLSPVQILNNNFVKVWPISQDGLSKPNENKIEPRVFDFLLYALLNLIAYK